jgi:hypothetical protein
VASASPLAANYDYFEINTGYQVLFTSDISCEYSLCSTGLFLSVFLDYRKHCCLHSVFYCLDYHFAGDGSQKSHFCEEPSKGVSICDVLAPAECSHFFCVSADFPVFIGHNACQDYQQHG